MNMKPDPEEKPGESRAGTDSASAEATDLFATAAPDDFWELDDALKHELINRSLRNLLGDC
jgi:hypothetical protein